MITQLLAPILAAVSWRLRGGAFTAITGLSFGTDFARAVGALGVSLSVVLATHRVEYLALIPTLFAGLAVTGWGPFQGMGLPAPYAPEKSWLRWLPLRLGLPAGSMAHDAVGMAEAGLLCAAPSAALLGCLCGPAAAAGSLLGGLLFPVAYLIPRFVPLPPVPRFASGQAWGEVFAGAILGASLGIAAGT